ncbi:hypothetical protein [Colwellia sp. TT2012]|uniref:hypothetical protein n=1 Tax=Colwellia sp. TT2012 TaxID=1720342 RepID=UPI000B24D9BE|nr:hypothetical protein [Colwellia sp. TT2012]
MMKLTSLIVKVKTRGSVVNAKVKTRTGTKIAAKLALLSSAFLLVFSAHSVQGAEKNYDILHKQLNIMNDIMMSSAKSPQNSHQSLIRSIESVYLQGQGAIFTINSAHGGSSHRQFFQRVAPLAPLAPKAPLVSVASISATDRVVIDNEDFVIDFDDHEDEFERVMEIFELQREGARELRSEEREIAYAMRDIARQRKDIEYQLHRAEKIVQVELTAELNKLKVARVVLDSNKKQLEQKVSQLNSQRKQQQLAQSKARSAHFSALNNTLVETLCLYGNGLRAVPSTEYVSLIIKDAGSKQGRGYKDQILVFNKKDINACANSKLTAKKLLAKAEQYQF